MSDGLWCALLAFQANAPAIKLDATNPHFKSRFASLPKIMDAVRPELAKAGLVWTTLPGVQDGQPVLHYRLAHAASGESLDGTMPLMLAKSDPQGLGSAITYARRYAVLAVLGLVGDEDDDGVAAARPRNGQAQAQAPRQSPEPATPDQRRLIFARAKERDIGQDALKALLVQVAGTQSTDRLAKDKVDDVLAAIEAANA